MSSKAPAQENKALSYATRAAVSKLIALRGEPNNQAWLVRSIIYDIGFAAKASLPPSLRVILPPDSHVTINDKKLNWYISHMTKLAASMK